MVVYDILYMSSPLILADDFDRQDVAESGKSAYLQT